MRDDPKVGTSFAGYRLEALLGQDRVGTTYVAWNARLERPAEVRIVGSGLAADPGFRARFLRESGLVASIGHPGIVPVYESGEDGGCLYVVTARVEGTDLARLLVAGGRLAPRRAVALVGHLAESLDTARWSRGLVHGCLCPGEVLVVAAPGASDRVLLRGFGLRRELPPGTAPADVGDRFDTVGYLAPEQVEGRPVSPRADVYALGCLLFECLTGKPPFEGPAAAVLDGHLNTPPPAPARSCPGLSAAFDGVIAKAMARLPDERYSTCGELAAAAEAALAEGERPGGAPSREQLSGFALGPRPRDDTDRASDVEPDPPVAERWVPRRRAAPAMGLGVLLVALVAGVAWLTLRGTGESRSVIPPAPGLGAAGEVAAAAGQAAGVAAGTEPPAEDATPEETEPPPATEAPVEPAAEPGLVRIVSFRSGSLVKIDAETGEIVASVALQDPARLASDGEAVWALTGRGSRGNLLFRVDAAAGAVTEVFDAGRGRRTEPAELAAAGGSAWLHPSDSGRVYRFDPGADAGVPVEFDGTDAASFHGPVAGPDSLWVLAGTDTSPGTRTVLRVEPETGRVLARIAWVGPIVVAGERFLWAHFGGPSEIVRVDVESGSVAPVDPPALPDADFTVADGAVWATRPEHGTVVRLDPATGEETGRVRVWPRPRPGGGELRAAIASGGGAVWVANQLDGAVARYELATGRIETIDVGGIPNDLVFARGSIWAAVVPLTRAAWIDRAGAVCRAANRRLERAVAEIEPLSETGSWPAGQLEAWSAAVAHASEEALEELRALRRPDSRVDREWVKRALVLFDEQTRAVRRVEAAAAAGNAERATALERERVEAAHRKDAHVGDALSHCPVPPPA